jgi:hypothetical protein
MKRLTHTSQLIIDRKKSGRVIEPQTLLTLPEWRHFESRAKVILREGLLLVGRVGECSVVVLGISVRWPEVMFWSGLTLVVDQDTIALSDIPLHQVFKNPVLVFPFAVCFEIVLPGPPFHFRLAVCTRDADEAFQRTFGGSFAMFHWLVVAIKVVVGREADVFGNTFGVTAPEWLGVFAFMFALTGQRECPTTHEDEDTCVWSERFLG